MTTLQVSLLLKPPISLRFSPLKSQSFPSFRPLNSRKFSINCCTLQPQKPHISSNTNPNENPTCSNSNIDEQISGFSSEFNESSENPTSNGGDESVLRVEEGKIEGQNGNFKLGIVVFLVGVWGAMKKWFEKVWLSGWLSWWPWQQEKRLQRLIAEADANPNDGALQGALLAELNKHRL